MSLPATVVCELPAARAAAVPLQLQMDRLEVPTTVSRTRRSCERATTVWAYVDPTLSLVHCGGEVSLLVTNF